MVDALSTSSSVSSANAYASSLRSARLHSSYQRLASLEQLSSLSAVSGVSSSLLGSTTNLLDTAYLNRLYGTSTNVQLSSQGRIQASLSELKQSLDQLSTAEQRVPLTSSSSNTKVATATANTTTLPATQNISVRQLAQTQQLQSAKMASDDFIVGSGTLTFRFGQQDGTGQLSDLDRTATVRISSGDTSLGEIANVINRAKIGVKAEVLSADSGSTLQLSSSDTGAAQAFSVTVKDSDGNNTDQNGLSQLAYDFSAAVGSGRNLGLMQSAQNASVTLNGRTLSVASNTLKDAVTSTTLNVQSVGDTQISYSRDLTALQGNIQKVVDALNQAQNQLTAIAGGQASKARKGLQTVMSSAASGVGLDRVTWADLGISRTADGSYVLNTQQFSTASKANSEGVANLLGDTVSNLSKSLMASLERNGGLSINLQRLREQFSSGQIQTSNTFSLQQGTSSYYSIYRSLQQYWVVSSM